MKVNQGYDAEVVNMFGDVALPPAAGTSTGTSATTMTDTGGTFGTNTYKWHVIVVGAVYGIIQAHTPTVVTVDRWYTVNNPGAAAASTPSATSAYMILSVGAACAFVALTTTGSFTPGATDTTLSAEISGGSSGLVRKLTTPAHTASASTATLTTVFTAATESFPVAVTGAAVAGSIVKDKGPLLYEDAFTTPATLAAPSDQLTTTHSITL